MDKQVRTEDKMDCPETIRTAKREGYTHIHTYGGLVPLEEWTPYGQADGHGFQFYLYSERGDNGIVDGIRESHESTVYPPGFVSGVWKLYPQAS